jgi:hypothetical protein
MSADRCDAASVDVRQVDPRDIEWEVLSPPFRVYFTDDTGATDEFELVGTEVDGVLRWARDNAGARSFDVYVVVDHRERGLARIGGDHP